MTPPRPPEIAIVVFVDHVECLWLRLLRRGFRHCFAAVSDGACWVVCDPLKDRMEITFLHPPASFDLAGFYAGRGYEVLIGKVDQPPAPTHLTLAPLTCVAIVKRILGLKAGWVLTPHQLFCHLSALRDGAFTRYAAPSLTQVASDEGQA